MTYPWQPMDQSEPEGAEQTGPPADLDAWSELFATTIAHLAAQLTMTQLRLRALGNATAAAGAVEPEAVKEQLRALAEQETGRYLRENLGSELADAIDTESLEREIVAFLHGEAAR